VIARADIDRQGLGEFFLDDLCEYQAGVAVPSPAAQARLLPLLRDNPRATRRLHEPSYNMLAYPWATRYQQSNQWAIETLASAQDPAGTTRERAQHGLHANTVTADSVFTWLERAGLGAPLQVLR
jgi:hypothetical protein